MIFSNYFACVCVLVLTRNICFIGNTTIVCYRFKRSYCNWRDSSDGCWLLP